MVRGLQAGTWAVLGAWVAAGALAAGEPPASGYRWPLWSGARADDRNSGRCRVPAGGTGQPAWTARLSGTARANPAVDADGHIYVVTDQGLESFDGDGKARWIYTPPEPAVVEHPPAVDIRGHVLVLDRGGLSAVRCADGRAAWRATLEGSGFGPVAVSPNGYIYLGRNRPGDGRATLLALRPDGQALWREATAIGDRPGTHGAPAVASNHTVLIPSTYAAQGDQPVRSMIWAVDFNGYHEFRYLQGGLLFTPVLLTPDNLVFFASYRLGPGEGKLWALTLMGQERWERTIGRGTRTALAYGLDGRLRVFDDDSGTLYAFDTWGDLAWQYRCGKPVRQAPVVTQDNVTYIHVDGHVIALDGQGNVLWGPRPFPSDTPLVIGRGGSLLGITGGRTLAALR